MKAINVPQHVITSILFRHVAHVVAHLQDTAGLHTKQGFNLRYKKKVTIPEHCKNITRVTEGISTTAKHLQEMLLQGGSSILHEMVLMRFALSMLGANILFDTIRFLNISFLLGLVI